MTACPTRRETFLGIGYLAFQYTLLPPLIYFFNDQLSRPLSETRLNLLFFALNFLLELLIFHRFLRASLVPLKERPGRCVWLMAAGFLLCFLGQRLVALLISLWDPDFLNQNDQALGVMAREELPLLALGTVIFVPPAEECLHRGTVFRGLYDKSPLLAYLISSLLFAAIHILGYLDLYSGREILLAGLQYLVPGLVLAWAYHRSDTIYVPIVIHALINLIGIVTFL